MVVTCNADENALPGKVMPSQSELIVDVIVLSNTTYYVLQQMVTTNFFLFEWSILV